MAPIPDSRPDPGSQPLAGRPPTPLPCLEIDVVDDPMARPAQIGVVTRLASPATPDGLPRPIPTARYDGLPGSSASWYLGFAGLPPLAPDLGLPVDAFPTAFRSAWQHTLESVLARPEAGPPNPQRERLRECVRHHGGIEALVEGESRFVSLLVHTLERWAREDADVVLWDIDGTMFGTTARYRFMTPSSEVTLRYAARNWPRLRHGILTSVAHRWIPPALHVLQNTLQGAPVRWSADHLFSLHDPISRLDVLDWSRIEDLLRTAGLPAANRGHLPGGWPVNPVELTRVLAFLAIRRQGADARFVDNDLNLALDASVASEEALSAETRTWLRSLVGGHFAAGAHWFPERTEDFIGTLLGD